MRHLLLAFALLAACGSDPSPTPDASAPCGGACGPGTVCSAGRCVAEDAGADAAPEVGIDVNTPEVSDEDAGEDARDDAAADSPPMADAVVDGDPRCTPPTLRFCGSGCHDLSSSQNHCGACGNACGPGSQCQTGACVACPEDPRLPGPYQPCAGPSAQCRGGARCVTAIAVYRTGAPGYVCSAECLRADTCPLFSGGGVDCLSAVDTPNALRCVRLCPAPGERNICPALGLPCMGVTNRDRRVVNLCVE